MASLINGYIGKLNPGNGTEYSLGSTVYAECSTAAATAQKEIELTGFTLMQGATIFIKFINGNTTNNPTLKIQTGASVYADEKNIIISNLLPENSLVGLTYDGAQWVTIDNQNTSTILNPALILNRDASNEPDNDGNKWYKILTFTLTKFSNLHLSLLITESYNKNFGILRLYFNMTSGGALSGGVTWQVINGFQPDDVKYSYNYNGNKTDDDYSVDIMLYIKKTGNNLGRVIVQTLNSGTRGSLILPEKLNWSSVYISDADMANISTIAATVENTASRLSNTSAIGATNQPVYFTANGVPTAISYTIAKSVPSTAVFTDTNVTQGETTSTNWRKVLLFNSTSTTVGAAISTTTGQVYAATGVAVQPSTGILWANGLQSNSVTATTFNGNLVGNAASATKLATAVAIDGVNFDGSTNIVHYGISNTTASTTAKTVTIPNFTLTNGAVAYVSFTNNNVRANPTLNINSTGAKPIYDEYGQRLTGYTSTAYPNNFFTNKIYQFIYSSTLDGYILTNSPKSIELIEPRYSTTSLNKDASFGNVGSMFHMIASTSSTVDTETPNGTLPLESPGHVLQMNWDNTSGNYNSQFAICISSSANMINRAWFRKGATENDDWQEIAHATAGAAVGSTSQPVYMAANGVITAITGALGNDITGNAASADKLSTSGTTAKFWRGDNTWSNELEGQLKLSSSLIFTNTNDGAKNLITFSRTGANYIAIPDSTAASFNIVVGQGLFKNVRLYVDDTQVLPNHPGATDNNAVILGNNEKRWSKIYGIEGSFSSTADSSYSSYSSAGVVLDGGLSVAKQISAKQIKIDNGSTTNGVQLIYDSSLEVLNFVFA